MSAETPNPVETLRLSLVACVSSLMWQQQKLYHLNVAVKSLLETLQKHDSGLLSEYEEARRSIAAGELSDLNTLDYQSLDSVLEILKAIPKAD